MTTFTATIVCDNSTITNFKAWGSTISTAFSTIGWTQTTDTGQVNWSTISTVPSSAYVYEIWKSADALSSTLPIFVKIFYGFTSTNPRIQTTVGTGSDGAGNITGSTVSSAPWLITGTATANQGTATFPCFFSGSTGEFRMYMWSTSSVTITLPTLFGIERSKSATGTDTASYFTVLSCGGQIGAPVPFQQTVLTSSVGLRDTGWCTIAGTPGAGTGSALGTVAAFPVFPILGLIGNPMIGWASAYAADISNGSVNTISSMYGSTHTYIGISQPANTPLQQALGERALSGAFMAGLMRYD